MNRALRWALCPLLLAAGAAAAQDAASLPKCTSAESMQLTREHRWADALELKKRELATIDPARTDEAAVGVRVCMRAYVAVYNTRLERHKEAMALFEGLLPEARAALGPDHKEVLNAELLASYAYGGATRYQEQISLLQSMRPRVARVYGASSAELHNVLQNLATAYHWTRNVADAEALERQALAITQANLRDGSCKAFVNDCRMRLARDQQHLGDTLRRIDRAQEALPLLEASLAMQTELAGPLHPNTLDARLVLASVHQALGARDKALEMDKETLELAEKNLGPEHPVTRKARGNYAVSLSATGRQADAITLEREQLAQLRERRGPNHPETLLSLSNLSDRLLDSKRIDEALPVLEEALAAMLATRGGLAFDDRLTLAWQAHWRRVVDNYLVALLAKRRTGDALLAAEYFKARLLADRLSLDPAERTLGDEERTALRKMRRSLASVDQSLALKRSLRQATMKEEAERNVLLKQITDFRPPEAAAPLATTLPSTRNVPDWYVTLSRAEPDSARVSYLFLKGQLGALVDRGGDIRALRLGSADAVKDTIEAYRLMMRQAATAGSNPKAKPLAVWKRGSGGGYTVDKPNAEAEPITEPRLLLEYLSDALVKPIEAELKGKRRLLVSPDQVIAHVPFDSLLLGGARLGDTMEVAMIPSFALHAQLARRSAEYGKLARRPFLGLGGAPYQRVGRLTQNVFIQREREVKLQAMDFKVIAQSVRKDPSKLGLAFASYTLGFPDLPGTLGEVRAIAQLYGPEGTYLSGERASEASLNELAERGELGLYRVIHFAAHGFISDDEPGLSAIVLSQVNRAPGTDGYVTVAELAGLDLRSDLVVISACDSGVGKAQQGEALLGLSYALFQAGSTASLVTLWPIADQDAAKLMVRFYEELRGVRVGNARALAAAKRWALANGVSRTSVDAFVLFGG